MKGTQQPLYLTSENHINCLPNFKVEDKKCDIGQLTCQQSVGRMFPTQDKNENGSLCDQKKTSINVKEVENVCSRTWLTFLESGIQPSKRVNRSSSENSKHEPTSDSASSLKKSFVEKRRNSAEVYNTRGRNISSSLILNVHSIGYSMLKEKWYGSQNSHDKTVTVRSSSSHSSAAGHCCDSKTSNLSKPKIFGVSHAKLPDPQTKSPTVAAKHERLPTLHEDCENSSPKPLDPRLDPARVAKRKRDLDCQVIFKRVKWSTTVSSVNDKSSVSPKCTTKPISSPHSSSKNEKPDLLQQSAYVSKAPVHISKSSTKDNLSMKSKPLISQKNHGKPFNSPHSSPKSKRRKDLSCQSGNYSNALLKTNQPLDPRLKHSRLFTDDVISSAFNTQTSSKTPVSLTSQQRLSEVSSPICDKKNLPPCKRPCLKTQEDFALSSNKDCTSPSMPKKPINSDCHQSTYRDRNCNQTYSSWRRQSKHDKLLEKPMSTASYASCKTNENIGYFRKQKASLKNIDLCSFVQSKRHWHKKRAHNFQSFDNTAASTLNRTFSKHSKDNAFKRRKDFWEKGNKVGNLKSEMKVKNFKRKLAIPNSKGIASEENFSKTDLVSGCDLKVGHKQDSHLKRKSIKKQMFVHSKSNNVNAVENLEKNVTKFKEKKKITMSKNGLQNSTSDSLSFPFKNQISECTENVPPQPSKKPLPKNRLDLYKAKKFGSQMQLKKSKVSTIFRNKTSSNSQELPCVKRKNNAIFARSNSGSKFALKNFELHKNFNYVHKKGSFKDGLRKFKTSIKSSKPESALCQKIKPKKAAAKLKKATKNIESLKNIALSKTTKDKIILSNHESESILNVGYVKLKRLSVKLVRLSDDVLKKYSILDEISRNYTQSPILNQSMSQVIACKSLIQLNNPDKKCQAQNRLNAKVKKLKSINLPFKLMSKMGFDLCVDFVCSDNVFQLTATDPKNVLRILKQFFHKAFVRHLIHHSNNGLQGGLMRYLFAKILKLHKLIKSAKECLNKAIKPTDIDFGSSKARLQVISSNSSLLPLNHDYVSPLNETSTSSKTVCDTPIKTNNGRLKKKFSYTWEENNLKWQSFFQSSACKFHVYPNPSSMETVLSLLRKKGISLLISELSLQYCENTWNACESPVFSKLHVNPVVTSISLYENQVFGEFTDSPNSNIDSFTDSVLETFHLSKSYLPKLNFDCQNVFSLPAHDFNTFSNMSTPRQPLCNDKSKEEVSTHQTGDTKERIKPPEKSINCERENEMQVEQVVTSNSEQENEIPVDEKIVTLNVTENVTSTVTSFVDEDSELDWCLPVPPCSISFYDNLSVGISFFGEIDADNLSSDSVEKNTPGFDPLPIDKCSLTPDNSSSTDTHVFHSLTDQSMPKLIPQVTHAALVIANSLQSAELQTEISCVSNDICTSNQKKITDPVALTAKNVELLSMPVLSFCDSSTEIGLVSPIGNEEENPKPTTPSSSNSTPEKPKPDRTSSIIIQPGLFKCDCFLKYEKVDVSRGIIKDSLFVGWDLFKDGEVLEQYCRHWKGAGSHSVNLDDLRDQAELSKKELESYKFLNEQLEYHKSLMRGYIHRASDPQRNFDNELIKKITEELDYIEGYELAAKAILL